MCGLVGVAGNLGTKDIKVFKELLYVDKLRGVDSTGIGIVQGDGEVLVLKGPWSPETLLDFKVVDQALLTSAKVLMGHNRAATRGKVSKQNAHPWFTGRILGAHNGTLDCGCLKDLEKNYEGDTDSEQLINSIHSLDGKIADALKLAAGAWALTIYDRETEGINLVRTDQRPLFYALSESRDTLYWASEAYMLRWILERNEVKILDNKIHLVTPDVIFSWAIPDRKHIFQDKPNRQAAPGKRVQNFHAPYANNRETWESWLEGRPDNGPRDTAAKSGTGYSAYQKKKRLPNVPGQFYDAPVGDPDIIWEIYGWGWECAERSDLKYDNPFVMNQQQSDDDTVYDPIRFNAYNDGFQAYHKYKTGLPVTAGKEDIAKGKSEMMAKAKIEKLVKQAPPSKSPVGQLVDEATKPSGRAKKEVGGDNVVKLNPQVKDVVLNRTGPAGKKISAGKFFELTGHTCQWCEGPFNPQTDNGKFVEMQTTVIRDGEPVTKTEWTYCCEECITDPVQNNYITEAEKAVNDAT